MAQTVNVNIRMEAEFKKQLEELFAELGMNMTTAINIFGRQALREQGLPFVPTLEVKQEEPKQPVRKPFQFGCLEGKVRMADDFDAPMEEFQEYM